jgi:hypothetical protein
MNVARFQLQASTVGSPPAATRPVRLRIGASRYEALFGLAITALVPAVFWTGLVWLVSPLLGWHMSAMTLGIIAGSITLFLTLICSALLLRS